MNIYRDETRLKYLKIAHEKCGEHVTVGQDPLHRYFWLKCDLMNAQINAETGKVIMVAYPDLTSENPPKSDIEKIDRRLRYLAKEKKVNVN